MNAKKAISGASKILTYFFTRNVPKASQYTIPVPIHIPLIVVAPLVARLGQVQRLPRALGTNNLVSFLLTNPSTDAGPSSFGNAGVVAAPLLLLFAEDCVAALALKVPCNAGIPAPPIMPRCTTIPSGGDAKD